MMHYHCLPLQVFALQEALELEFDDKSTKFLLCFDPIIFHHFQPNQQALVLVDTPHDFQNLDCFKHKRFSSFCLLFYQPLHHEQESLPLNN